MLTKEKALYQVKLILDYLPEEEYKLIPQDEIDYIEDNFEYDENISVDPNIPLEKQHIDEKTYEILDRIIKKAENNKKNQDNKEIDEYIKKVKESNENYNTKIENIKLNNLLETLKKENAKIPKAKELMQEYKDALKKKDDEIERLKQNNQELYEIIQRVPKFIKKIFIDENVDKLFKNSK